MTVDPEGNLHFSNVTRHDASEDSTYACSAVSYFRFDYFLLFNVDALDTQIFLTTPASFHTVIVVENIPNLLRSFLIFFLKNEKFSSWRLF